MGLRDELEPSKTTAVCFAGRLLKTLPVELSTELQEILDDEMVTNMALERLSRNKQWGVSASSFARHRKGECKCR